MKKKILAMALCAALLIAVMAGCAGSKSSSAAETSTQETAAPETAAPETTAPAAEEAPEETAGFNGAITVVSREEGSGTRGAFVELMGVQTEDGDMTTEDAEIANSTSLVQSTVAGNEKAIGYISLGSYDASAVKALSVDGVEASVDNVKAGSYAVSRPFVICYKEENLTDLGRDFISFIMSADGQAILTEKGYIAVDESAAAYTASGLTGNLSLNGSTSVGPVMEKLAEAYMGINEGVTIDIQQTGSGTGITSTIDGSCEIGMSSRNLKDEELAEGLTPVTIALDGIAVIVNQSNPLSGLASEQIRQIFTGEVTDWSEVG